MLTVFDRYFTYLTKCKKPKACTIVLRGASKDILNEIERNLLDAMNVSRNVIFDPRLLPGGGAVEMTIAHALREKSKSIEGVQQWPYRAIADAMEVIPRTLIQNCGGNVIRVLTELRAKHAMGSQFRTWGVDGIRGVIADMKDIGIWEPLTVKTQTIKTALESACLLLRVDDIVSGISKKKAQGGGGPRVEEEPKDENFGDQRDG